MKHLLLSLLVISCAVNAGDFESKKSYEQKRNRDAQFKAQQAARKKDNASKNGQDKTWANKYYDAQTKKK